MAKSVMLDDRPPFRYKDVVVSSDSSAPCNHFHDENDKVPMGVPNLNNREDEIMDIDETADIDTSWEDMVLDASGNLNQSHPLDIVPIQGERTDLRTMNTSDSITDRLPSEIVAGSGNHGINMLSGIPDPSRAIVRCENFHSQMTGLCSTRGRMKGLTVPPHYLAYLRMTI